MGYDRPYSYCTVKEEFEKMKETNKKDKLLTIGQFAAMHGINKKTLMWYDTIGLFCPAAINPENGYRCYDYHQSPVLETILLLRELDVPIAEIQAFLENRSAAAMKNLLEEKIEQLDRQMLHLQAVRKTLCGYRQNMTTLLTMDLTDISLVEKEERCLITVDIDKDTSFEKKVEMITAQTTRYQLGRLHEASYGSMIPVESLYSGHFDDYCRLFIEIPALSPGQGAQTPADSCAGQTDAGVHIQPGGTYLRAFHRGEWEKLPLCYERILGYADVHGLSLSGFSYEKGINETVIDNVRDYITQIEIPVAG